MSSPFFEASEGIPVRLRIGSCTACGHRFFPLQRLGCERCGAHREALGEALVPATGAVHAAIGVHRHRAPGIEAPFQVADVRLDAGPLVRVLLATPEGAPPPRGTRVAGTVIAGAESPVPPLRFAIEGGPS